MAKVLQHRLMTRSMGAPRDEAVEVDNLEDDSPIEEIRGIYLGYPLHT